MFSVRLAAVSPQGLLLWVILAAAFAAFAVLVIRGYIKKLSQGCCGGGGDGGEKKVRVRDRNSAHYPYTVILTVDGMVCGGCATRIENTLNALEGVWAKADVSRKTVLVRLRETPDTERLRSVVNGIGPYTVMNVTVPERAGMPGAR